MSNHISTKCGPRTRNVARNVAHYAARYVLCRNSDNHAVFQPEGQILHVPNFNTSFKLKHIVSLARAIFAFQTERLKAKQE